MPGADTPVIGRGLRSAIGPARRLIVLAFCWATALYAFMSASPFAYRQLVAPRVFAWVGAFSDWHARLYWVWFIAALPAGVLDRRRDSRTPSLAFAACWAVVGVAMTIHPVLPGLIDDRRSLGVGLVALAPIVWRAILDLCSTRGAWVLLRPETGDAEGRLLAAALGTAVFVTGVHAVQTSLTVGSTFEPDLLTAGLAAGFAWNLVDHLVILCAAFLVLGVFGRVARRFGPALRFGLLVAIVAGLCSAFAERTLCRALGFSGRWSAVVAIACGATVALHWAARSVRNLVRRQAASGSPFDVLFASTDEEPGRWRHLAPLVGLAIAAGAIGTISRFLDWDFVLLETGVFAIWVAAFVRLYRLCPPVRVGPVATVVACLLPLAAYASVTASDERLTPRHALDRYAVYSPSFRVVDRLLRDAFVADDDGFQQFLRANTGLGNDAHVSPVSVDFSPPGTTARATPHIFLFVVDSLRRDYLQPYNARVTFTPQIARFGAESLVFRNAFTAYGGTGLSVPAIWSGSVGAHKQYVTPFTPMNALAKLLDVNHYRQFLTRDSVVRQILPASPSTTDLDRGRASEDVSFCGTVAELETRLDATSEEPGPVFVYSLPQDLHISNVMSASVPAGESYPGFHAPYAARVHRIDACFGQFVDFLRRRGWYDRSLVVLTADHGEMLGEQGVWGHVYYLFPPVVAVPLIVHLPWDRAAARPAASGDVSLTTDITPTIYAALGYDVRRVGALTGRPLVGAPASDDTGTRGPEVLTASYSAVYAALESNGRRLYIVDAVQHREYRVRARRRRRVDAGRGHLRDAGARPSRDPRADLCDQPGLSGEHAVTV